MLLKGLGFELINLKNLSIYLYIFGTSLYLNVNSETEPSDKSGNKRQICREKCNPKFCKILASLYLTKLPEDNLPMKARKKR